MTKQEYVCIDSIWYEIKDEYGDTIVSLVHPGCRVGDIVQGYSITEHDPDEGPIYLGAVTDPLHRPTEQVEAIIDSAWPDFQETKPDADRRVYPVPGGALTGSQKLMKTTRSSLENRRQHVLVSLWF